MKFYLLLALTFILNSSKADTYYFSSNSGDDSRKFKEAQNPSTPWKTLDKLNSYYSKLKDGDVVLFKRGETFYGSIIISVENKKKTDAITFGAYGSGAKPVITSLQTVSGWKAIGTGIYEKQNSSFPDTLNMVLFNDNLQPIGRWPKVDAPNGGYLTLQSHSGTSSITSSDIAAAKNFVGGELVIKKYQWILDRARITNQTLNTVSYTPITSPGHPNYTYEPTNNYGFFFQNHVNALTSLGDWAYEPSTKKLKMYFGNSNPDSYTVKVPFEENLVQMDNGDNLVFDNISFVGANANSVNMIYSTNIQINNCDINFSGVNGIAVFNGYYDLHKEEFPKGNAYGLYKNHSVPNGLSNNFIVTNNTITNTNNNAINGGNSNNWTIQNNVINKTGTIRGMGQSGDGQYEGIQYINSNSLVEYNKITNTGYLGVHFIGNNITIKNNYIDNFCMVKSDGGGIYTYGETGTGRKITGNIVSNGIGDVYGMNAQLNNPNSYQVHGIYMDGNSDNVTIENNTSFGNSNSGLFFGSSTNMTATNNLIYNNKVAQLKVIDSKKRLSNIVINNNMLVARDSAQLVASYKLVGENNNPFYNIGSVDYNYYCRPLYEPQSISTQGYSNAPTYFNYPGGGIVEALDPECNCTKFFSLDAWQSHKLGWDLHTKKSCVTINNLDKLRFEFNPTKTPKTIALDGTYVDVKNQSYSNSVSLAPYASILLIKQGTANQLFRTSTSANINASEFEPLTATSVAAFPNPFKSTATIQVTPTESGVASLELFDQQGRSVKKLFRGFLEAKVTKSFSLNSAGLSSGMYIIHFSTSTKSLTKKISLE